MVFNFGNRGRLEIPPTGDSKPSADQLSGRGAYVFCENCDWFACFSADSETAIDLHLMFAIPVAKPAVVSCERCDNCMEDEHLGCPVKISVEPCIEHASADRLIRFQLIPA